MTVMTKKGRYFLGKNSGDTVSCRPVTPTLETPLGYGICGSLF